MAETRSVIIRMITKLIVFMHKLLTVFNLGDFEVISSRSALVLLFPLVTMEGIELKRVPIARLYPAGNRGVL